MVLLYLGLRSVQRQHDAIETLLLSNLRLSGEKLAVELGHRSEQQAEACLRAAGAVADVRSLGQSQLRAEFERLRQRHAIAAHFFLLEANSVRYPPLHTMPPWEVESFAEAQSTRDGKKYAELFRRAEDQELRAGRLDVALSGYRRCYDFSAIASLRALALSRIARCQAKLHERRAAERAYGALFENFGDLEDLSHRPYALTAALELEATPARHAPLYQDVVRGRWGLSAEQVAYFLPRLDSPPAGSAAPDSDYLKGLTFAQALESGFRYHGPLRFGEVRAYAFAASGTGWQTYYTPLPPSAGTDALLGFAVNRTWWEQTLLPECRKGLGINEEFRAVASGPAPPGGAAGIRVALPGIFPFLELALAPASIPGSGPVIRDLTIYTAATLLVLAALVLGVFLLTRDVSRESRMNRTRSNFISAVSHELKTPLTLIRLYGDTLLNGAEEFTPEERRGFHQIISRESERLSHLIDNVLAVSRIERGQEQYHLREGDLGALVGETLDNYRQYLAKRGFDVCADLAAPLPPVRFDPEAVSQALLNLLENAAKYSGESRAIRVGLHEAGSKVILEVADRGIGIAPEEREKIFQQFYRAPHGGTQGGYGLGLFLVRHIMEAHSGTIEVQSEPRLGSRFQLIFPAV